MGKQGQLLLCGAPRGSWEMGVLRTYPQSTGKRLRASHLGKQQAKKNPALSENMQEQNVEAGARVKVLGWSS